MGCGGSTGSGKKIKMKTTKLKDVDGFFDDAQGIVDEIYEIQDPIDDAKDGLLEATGMEKVECADVNHAICGMVYAIAVQVNGDIDSAVNIVATEPFIEINKGKASGEVVKAVDHLEKYLKGLVAGKDRMEPLTKKVTDIVKKSAEIPNKAKAAAKDSNDLGVMDKLKAGKNALSNVKELNRVPGLCNDLKDTIVDALKAVKAATEEINDNKGKMAEFAQKCKSAKKSTPKDCYLLVGKGIKATPEQKKKWKAEQKAKAKGK